MSLWEARLQLLMDASVNYKKVEIPIRPCAFAQQVYLDSVMLNYLYQ